MFHNIFVQNFGKCFTTASTRFIMKSEFTGTYIFMWNTLTVWRENSPLTKRTFFNFQSPEAATGCILIRCWKFRKTHREHLCQGLFFNKVEGLRQLTNLCKLQFFWYKLWELICVKLQFTVEGFLMKDIPKISENLGVI